MEESYSDDEGPVMKKSQFIDDLKVKTTKETTTFYIVFYILGLRGHADYFADDPGHHGSQD